MHGQMNFDSGWEWGYWLNDVVTARASWNPNLEITDEWDAFRAALVPVTGIFGSKFSDRIADVLISLSKTQEELLINGIIDGKLCPNIKYLNGFGYMSGVDTWVDVPRMMGLAMTQPDKIHLHEFTHPLWKYVRPLLLTMEHTFGNISSQMDIIYEDFQIFLDKYRSCSLKSEVCRRGKTTITSAERGSYGPLVLPLLSELTDCVKIMHLRAKQIRLLYESKDLQTSADKRLQLLSESRDVLNEAEIIVKRRESFYRVPLSRIASWRENPTVYRYGYLWAVHSLYYWWRDQGLAEEGNMHVDISPCYLNRMDVTEIAVGWGKYTLELIRSAINRYLPVSTGYPLEIVNCIAPPSKGYTFPQDLYRR